LVRKEIDGGVGGILVLVGILGSIGGRVGLRFDGADDDLCVMRKVDSLALYIAEIDS
jgi:hypothetical protein